MKSTVRFNLIPYGFILLVVVALVFAGSARPVRAEDPKMVAVYFGMFDGHYTDTIRQDQTPWSRLDRVYIAFATVKGGALTDINIPGVPTAEAQERIRNLVTLCRNANPTAEIFISSNYGDEEDQEYLKAAKHPSRFADSVLKYLQTYGLDGYDMDWESQYIDDYAGQLKALLSATYSKLKGAGPSPTGGEYKLTHTIWPGVHSPSTVAAISDYVDGLNLMTYGTNSNLEDYASSYADAGVPYEKMLAGVESEFGYSGGTDTQESIGQKADFVAQHNLAGMFVWRMENDMCTPDGESAGGPPTFQVTNWVYDALRP
jgi:GH18 family chitinase